MDLQLKDLVSDAAADRFLSSSEEIRHIQEGIASGAKITSLTPDKTRLRKRLAREGQPDPRRAQERVNNVANFQDVCIVKKILRMSDAVCRIEMPSAYGSTAFGTGFLIGPGIIITNNHVFENPESAANALIRFRYELDEWSRPSADISFRLRPDKLFVTSTIEKDAANAYSGLDFTIVAVDESDVDGTMKISQFQHIELDGTSGKVIEGESCVIVQHPQGDYKKIVLRDIRMLGLTNDFLLYESDTLPGSSGSLVIGLGTGEAVALHHSGVPRKDAAGNWVRKDGSVVVDTDPDDEIDWIGNEGVRVSSILTAIAGMRFPDEMQGYQKMLMQIHVLPGSPVNYQPQGPGATNAPVEATNPSPVAMPTIPATPPLGPVQARLLYFDVVLVPDPLLQGSWSKTARAQIPGLIDNHRVFPTSTDAVLRRHYYITVQAQGNPWELAATIQKIPAVESCIPDIEGTPTNVEPVPPRGDAESAIFGGEDTDAENWARFKTQWEKAHWYTQAISAGPGKEREWNRYATRADKLAITADMEAALAKLRLVQLDTGYSGHSKNREGYDFARDYDLIDDDADALDEMDGGPLRQPGHGTRTASLVIGSRLRRDPFHCDGNFGVLTRYLQPDDSYVPLVKIWPYRVSRSVILLGRVQDMVEGARRAIDSAADVMFMCMGIYPRPVIDAVARYAYDKGVIWVCAAGNEVKVVVAPAVCPGTIAVAAINPANEPWKGSSYGKEVDIAAPGESVYVPVTDDEDNESMRYGNGTSYATPHVASAAMLWKAHHGTRLNMYKQKWQVVEAFRYCLRASAAPWENPAYKTKYGAGKLDIEALLNYELPPAEKLKYAYAGVSASPGWDLGIIESVHTIWSAMRRTVFGGEASFAAAPLSDSGRRAMEAFAQSAPRSTEASGGTLSAKTRDAVLRNYFESYGKAEN